MAQDDTPYKTIAGKRKESTRSQMEWEGSNAMNDSGAKRVTKEISKKADDIASYNARKYGTRKTSYKRGSK